MKVWLIVCSLFAITSVAFPQSQFILTISDSHGEADTGWVNQLRKLRPSDSILNVAVSGNTIGFDNLGRSSLNELRNVQHHLEQAFLINKTIDYIVVLLGTNDCKAVFDTLQHLVPHNLERLIQFIASYNFQQSLPPRIVLATPPPVANDETLEEKYRGAQKRLTNLLPHFKMMSEKYNCIFVDTHTNLREEFGSNNTDGIHLTEDGYKQIALLINEQLAPSH
jgi:lysophospholipase L1-like esterase